MASAPLYIEAKIMQRQVVLFSKSTSPECKTVKALLSKLKFMNKEIYEVVEIDKRTDCSEFEDYLWKLSSYSNRQVPLLFINGSCFGGYYLILRLGLEKTLAQHIKARLVPCGDELDDRYKADIIFTLAEIDQTDMVVQIVDEIIFPHRDGGFDSEDEDTRCAMLPYPGFDPWEDTPPTPPLSVTPSYAESFMDDTSASLQELRIQEGSGVTVASANTDSV